MVQGLRRLCCVRRRVRRRRRPGASALNRTVRTYDSGYESLNSHLLFRYSFNILFYILHFSFVLWLATNMKRMNSSS